MNKYLITLIIIIIVLYYAQKYCIQSEVQTFLLTKNVLEKFSESLNNEGGLSILGNIKLGNRHIISSNSDNLRITDMTTGNVGNLQVNNIDVNGALTMTQGFNFSGNNTSFTNGNARLNINGLNNGVGISSVNGPLTLNGVNTAPNNPNIILGGNTNIQGNFTINSVKPILTKIVTATTNVNQPIDTLINSTTYPSITFSGYVNTNKLYASLIEFNATIVNNKWHISFTPQPTAPISVRLTFFHNSLVEV